jgi:periplasmic protein TonB
MSALKLKPSGDIIMKLIELHSRGGNYMVIASNVAWLRTAENGQTLLGMVGGSPLLVTGTMEEVSAILLAGVADAVV